MSSCLIQNNLKDVTSQTMSLKWIQENLEAPTCDEECSDIDDSGTDNSYDSDLSETKNDNEDVADGRRKKRETTRHPTTTVTFDENGFVCWCSIHNQHKFNHLEASVSSSATSPVYTTNELKTTSCELWDPRKCIQNPAYQCRLIKFLCRTGYHLSISPVGRVRGQINVNDKIALFRIISVSYGVIKIQNPETGHYLAFNKKGHLYGELKESKDNIEWEQWSIGSYEAFRSRKYAVEGWWIGIKKNGRPKAGPKTAWGQKAIQFSVIGFDTE